MSSNKAIIGLQKQNDGIYSSLSAKGIQFKRIIVSEGISDDEHFGLLKEENARLKEVANANKQPSQPKEEKKKQEQIQSQIQSQSQQKKKSKAKNNEEEYEEEDEDEEETFKEPAKKFDTITNMDDLKRAFFNSDYETFESIIKDHPFKFYKVSYRYDSDKDGVPDFFAKNLLKGFVRSFDDHKKYFMICFRCWKYQLETKYKYESLWVVNTNEKISNVIGSIEEDFIFNEITDINEFVSDIKKLQELDSEEPVYIDRYTCISETYIH